jgi:lysophospholipase L1-like esterase
MLCNAPRLSARVMAAALVGLIVAGSTVAPAGPARAASRDAGPGALVHVASRLARQVPLRITAFGSSSTEGVGASSPAATYPNQLQLALASLLPTRPVVLNRGIGGEDADDMALRLPAILAEGPDLVIWQTGSNDPLRGVPLERFIERTRAGIAAIREAGVDVMLMEPQLCDRLADTPGSERYREALRVIGRDMGVPVIRRFDLMRHWLDKGLITRAGLLSHDGLHMADAGYAMLAAEVAQEILEAARPQAVATTALR